MTTEFARKKTFYLFRFLTFIPMGEKASSKVCRKQTIRRLSNPISQEKNMRNFLHAERKHSRRHICIRGKTAKVEKAYQYAMMHTYVVCMYLLHENILYEMYI